MRTTALRFLSSHHGSLGRAFCAALLTAALASPVVAQEADPPSRVARVELAEGGVQFQTAADPQPRTADPRWPLTTGDTVWTDATARAELHAGNATLRLDAGTAIGITALDDRTTQLRLTDGTLGIQVRALEAGERFEIDTPNLALVLSRPGRWRIDVDPAQGLTRIAAETGSAGTVFGENAESTTMAGPQRRDFTGRRLVSPAPLTLAANDDFDRWSALRDRALLQSPSARYVSSDIPGAQQLDAYGDWQNDPSYGPVWFPRVGVADWAPYRYGRWEWVAPWGWTWIDDAPWGFAPFHYGRWTQAGSRWGWVPGPAQARPAYAPALVGFLGNQGGNGNFVVGNGRPGVGWFPLAPGESWRPPFSASPGYIARLNRAGFAQNNITGYYYQTRPAAVTAIGVDDFGRRDLQRGRHEAVAAAELARAHSVQPPPWRGTGGAVGNSGVPAGRDRGYPPPPAVGRPFAGPYQTPGANAGFVGGGPVSVPQALPPSAPLADRVQQQQWQRSQQLLEDRQRNDILRQQQLRSAQDRFQPDAAQRQLQTQRDDMQMRQQRDEFERQRALAGQRDQLQRQQEQQQQQMRMQQQQLQSQQRQMQEGQQRMQEQQQRQAQQAQQEQHAQMQRLQEQQRAQQQQQQQQQQRQQQTAPTRGPDGRNFRQSHLGQGG